MATLVHLTQRPAVVMQDCQAGIQQSEILVAFDHEQSCLHSPYLSKPERVVSVLTQTALALFSAQILELNSCIPPLTMQH